MFLSLAHAASPPGTPRFEPRIAALHIRRRQSSEHQATANRPRSFLWRLWPLAQMLQAGSGIWFWRSHDHTRQRHFPISSSGPGFTIHFLIIRRPNIDHAAVREIFERRYSWTFTVFEPFPVLPSSPEPVTDYLARCGCLPPSSALRFQRTRDKFGPVTRLLSRGRDPRFGIPLHGKAQTIPLQPQIGKMPRTKRPSGFGSQACGAWW